MSKILNENALCLPLTPEEFEQYPVYGNSKNCSDFATFSVIFFPCFAPQLRCLRTPPINNILVNSIMPVKSFDPMNRRNPVQIYFEYSDIDSLDYQLEKEWDLDLNSFEVFDERYDYLDEKLRIRYTELVTDTKDVRTRYMSPPADDSELVCQEGKETECRPYFVIRLRSNGRLTTIIRVYPKALEILGEFGGMISLLMSILGIFYFLIHYNKSNYKTKKAIFGREWLREKRRARKNRFGLTKNRKEHKAIKQEDEEVEAEVLEEASDGLLLQRRMLETGLLTELLFKDYHRSLIPIIFEEDARRRLKISKQMDGVSLSGSVLSQDSSLSLDLGQSMISQHSTQGETFT